MGARPIKTVPFDPETMRVSGRFAAMIDDLIESGAPHEDDYLFLKAYSPPDILIIDVGSNIGNSAISFNTMLPGVRIVGFEPNPIVHDLLDRAQAHCRGFTWTPVGLGEAATARPLYVPVVDGILVVGEGSVDLEQFARPVVAARLRGYSRSGNFSITRLSSRIERLDDQAALFAVAENFRKRVVKIDVEGTELSVLKGGSRFLATYRPTLIIEEGHRSDITAFLSGIGYSRYIYAPDAGGLVEAAGRTRLNSVFVWRGLCQGPSEKNGGVCVAC